MTERLTDEALLPCPFCGGGVSIRKDGDYTIVGCKNCSAETADEVKRKAIAAWNRRATPADDLRAAARDALASVDAFMSGAPITDAQKVEADRLALAAAFASGAFRAAYDQGQGTHATMRAFLTAIVDPLHPDLDYLRADPASGASARAALSQPAPAPQPADDLRAAARDVLAERARQIAVEGWDDLHDDMNDKGELAQAAACYALSGTPADEAVFIHGRWKDARDLFWPHSWDRSWWKPSDRRRDLVKAGALILAEIERLDRAALSQKGGDA